MIFFIKISRTAKIQFLFWNGLYTQTKNKNLDYTKCVGFEPTTLADVETDVATV